MGESFILLFWLLFHQSSLRGSAAPVRGFPGFSSIWNCFVLPYKKDPVHEKKIILTLIIALLFFRFLYFGRFLLLQSFANLGNHTQYHSDPIGQFLCLACILWALWEPFGCRSHLPQRVALLTLPHQLCNFRSRFGHSRCFTSQGHWRDIANQHDQMETIFPKLSVFCCSLGIFQGTNHWHQAQNLVCNHQKYLLQLQLL